ncbi:MAG: hypothetical protein Q8S21_01955, partial [Candidatus Paracaedibacteraceae bacterium]|nr:hypothetical protein [Candidatus Paracaedibacteraceae bacterium]
MSHIFSILILITFAWTTLLQAFPYVADSQDIFAASKLGTGANALFGENVDLKNAFINAAVSAMGACASTNIGVAALDNAILHSLDAALNAGIGATSGFVTGKNGDAALVGAAGGAIGSMVSKLQTGESKGSSNTSSYGDKVKDAFKKSLPQLAAVTATMFIGLGEHAAIASQTAATAYEGVQSSSLFVQRREEIRAFEAQLQQEALARVKETEARENAAREEEAHETRERKTAKQSQPKAERAQQREKQENRGASGTKDPFAHSTQKTVRDGGYLGSGKTFGKIGSGKTRTPDDQFNDQNDFYEDAELSALNLEFIYLTHLEHFDNATSAVDAVNATSSMSGKMSPTSFEFYTNEQSAERAMQHAERTGDDSAYFKAIEERHFWSNQYDERQQNMQGNRMVFESARDVSRDLGQNWQSYGMAAAEALPFGVGTSVEAAHHGYDVYKGTQTVFGAAGIMATEAAVGYAGGKALKLVGKFGVKVIHAVKHKIPVPRNALSSGNVLGSKGLTVAHKQPEGL